MDASLTPPAARPGLIRWHYLWYVAAAMVVLVVAIAAGNVGPTLSAMTGTAGRFLAVQMGVMQIAIIVVMARLATGV